MRREHLLLIMATLMVWNAAAPADDGTASSGKTQIVVDLGPYDEAAAAGHSEERVNWLDGDTRDDTVCTQAFAALQLQHYLRLATGRSGDFAITDDEAAGQGDWLLVGGPDSNAACKHLPDAVTAALSADLGSLGPQGYRIRTLQVAGRRVTCLAGGSRIGTLYAACDLLHRLGVRWFAPEPIHEEVPRVQSLGEHDVTARPSFLTRGFHAWEDRGDEAFLLWMARNRLNYWCVEQSDHPLMRKLGILTSCGAHDAQKRFLDPDGPYPYDHPRFTGDETRPADPYPAGDLYRGDADKDGTLTTFEAHPEWFPVVKGKRVPGIRGEFGTNFCTSNPHATAEFMTNYVRALIDGPYRDADVVRFWTLDGGKWCECDACKALGTPTDRNLLLVRHLDAAIKKARAAGRIHRPLIVRFLVYADVLAPPSRPLPADFDYDTCSATYFPITRSYVYPFEDARSPRNAHYYRQLQGWVAEPDRHYRGRLCIGEYYNVSGYKCLPLCFMHTMAVDIPAYHRMGARHFHYMHCTTADMGNKALTNYQMARQLWDVTTDCETLWTDYFARRYGPAAATMRQFYESLETMLANVTKLKYDLARRLDRGEKDLFPTPELRYERAEGVTSNGPTLREMLGHAAVCRRLITRAMTPQPQLASCVRLAAFPSRQELSRRPLAAAWEGRRAGDSAAAPLGRGQVPGLPERIGARVAEDERLFTYGEQTLQYYDACVQTWRAVRAKRIDAARTHLAEAVRLADLLRRDTTSTKHSSSHANAANAFEATRATRAIAHLERALGQDGSAK